MLPEIGLHQYDMLARTRWSRKSSRLSGQSRKREGGQGYAGEVHALALATLIPLTAIGAMASLIVAFTAPQAPDCSSRDRQPPWP